MFSKLALRNVLRSLKDYSVYFITITFGVCIFYIFNSMESQTVMSFLGGKASAYVTAFLGIIDLISVFVSVVLAFLILYANTFLIRRRKKELGTYLLLGLPQGRVAGLLFLETLLIGLLSNLPLAQASGMGLNAYFVYTVCVGLGLSYANALVLVLFDGIIFVLLTVTGLRKIIFDSIPHEVKVAISAGIGLFIAFIGLQNAGIVVNDASTCVNLHSFNV